MGFLIVYSVIVSLLLIGVSIIAFRYGRTLLNIEDNIDVCLYFIENRYKNILTKFNKSEILLLSDEIKNFILEIRKINDDIRLMFSALSNSSINFKAEIGLEDIQTTVKTEDVNPAIAILKEHTSGIKKKENQTEEEGS